MDCRDNLIIFINFLRCDNSVRLHRRMFDFGRHMKFLQVKCMMSMPDFQIDWSTGELLYSGGYFTFWVDEDGILRWGVETEGSES